MKQPDQPKQSDKKQRVTLKQVAAHAGVSLTTASLALRGHSSIPEVTCRKVFDAISELGYVYDRSAANLRSGSTSTSATGIIVSDLVNPFYTELLIGIQQKLNETEQTSLLGTTFDSYEVQDRMISMMLEYRVSGILLFVAPGTKSEVITRIRRFGIPVVLINRIFPELPCDYVGVDNENGGFMATNHLIDSGHRRIAFIGGTHQFYTWHGRLLGYKSALASAGIEADESLILQSPCSREYGGGMVDQLLALPHPPTAIFCYNDTIAIGAMMALKERGVVPGRDLAIVGFDNIPEGVSFSPSLTSISSSPRLIGANAIDLLHRRIADPDMPVQNIILPAELIIRDSSGAPQQY
jgi:LacI family transcriptional regulator